MPERPPPGGRRVSAPVRIADADTVALLRPGDRVDVVATGEVTGGDDVRVLARGARVSEVPEAGERAGGGTGGGTEAGALVVLSVARATAVRLAAAGTATRLAVTLW
ncbi:RcpC/CpaB family pilus assembly protein [Streptomyces sp. ZYX-F-203]